MKNKIAVKSSFLLLMMVFGGCSLIDSTNNSTSGTTTVNLAQKSADAAQAGDKKGETTSVSPCQNRYNPVVDGAKKTYKMSTGDDARFVQKYVPGEAKFFEEFTIKGTTVKHEWECTNEGLIAANPGSMMNSGNMQLEPKHISGVTLPKDSEIKIGKTWSTVYQATGKSEIGAIDSTVTVNSKVVALDDEVKVPAGTFKAVKIEQVLNVEMKLNGKKISVPAFNTAVWFAPEVGMVKNGLTGGGLGNPTMELSGNK